MHSSTVAVDAVVVVVVVAMLVHSHSGQLVGQVVVSPAVPVSASTSRRVTAAYVDVIVGVIVGGPPTRSSSRRRRTDADPCATGRIVDDWTAAAPPSLRWWRRS